MSTTVSARLPDELLAWMKQQPEKTNNELILNALYTLKELRSNGGYSSDPVVDPTAPAWAERLIGAIELLTNAIQPSVPDPATIQVWKNERTSEPTFKAKRPSGNHHQPPPEPIDTSEADLENATGNFMAMFG